MDRYFHTATLLTGGRVLFTGGVSNTDQASAEFYTPFFTPEPGLPVGEPIEPTGTSLLVQVVDPSRAPLSGATVSVAGLERTTDSGGNALFEGLAAGSILAQVRAPGFAPGTVAAELEPGVHGGATATLAPLNPPIPFNADEDANIVTEQVQVRIPAGSLVDDNGLPVTGNAEIVFAPIDPTTNDIESSPGPLVGITSSDEEEVGLDSGFMAEISLMQNGRQLQLAPGARATITYTLPPAFAATKAPGDLIPAWWFDLETGVWRQDGIGIVTESPTEPGKLLWTVEVSHFTAWNCDEPWETQSCANVLVTDHAGRPLAGRSISARGLSYSYSYSTVTKSNGKACIPVMKNGRVQISLGSSSAPLASVVITPTGNGRCGSSACTPVTLQYLPCSSPGAVQTCAYTGPSGTNGVGTCKAGYRVCNGYTWGDCSGQVTPSAEVCRNTTDENCNGVVNDGCPLVCRSGSTRACYSGPASTQGVGICKAGTETCVGGRWNGVCTGQVRPSPREICTNSLDDDCDRMTDEGCICTPGDTKSCYNGPAGTNGVGVCKAGTQTCYAGAGSAPPFFGACTGEVTPSSEVCDGRDNNCNSTVDESNPGGGASCSTGRPGVCSAGTTTCSSGALVCTATTSPSAETCDGRDNNCDGSVDEGNPGSGASCSTGKPGVCSAGTTTCNGGALLCTATTSPSAENCDGRDNDCYGKVDEGNPGGGTSCTTRQPGVCSAGITTCSGGAIACITKVSPSTEVCGDSLDNDCDGATDEDCSGGTFSFTYSVVNTSSATRNTEDREITLRAGQTIIVGTCNITGASGAKDTYLRLFGPSGSLAIENDDYCGAGSTSYLTYTVPAGAAGTYVIKAGCWDETDCSGTVVYSF
ncbi:MAG TPA: MopE-related protein [Archangium sp.]|nr:MopE-related protein [Archangium sp.]